jgi:hypothetical protein
MEEAKKIGWEAAARRTLISEKVELKALPGFYIRARKYSISANDEIRAAQIRRREIIPAAVRDLLMRSAVDGRPVSEIAAELGEKDAEKILASIPPEASSVSDIMRICLLYGIGEHNLTDDGSESTLVTPALVARIMEYKDTATEAFAAVQEWNSPLAKTTSGQSRTSPNGDTEALPSNTEKSSLTEEAPPS